MELELWGGIECTVNRVGERYFDQCDRNGHDLRTDDLDRFSGLGLKRLRYPVLWEKTAPRDIDECDFRVARERLTRIRDLGMKPIVGLLHHGSGPKYTNLLDPEFPFKLARYARKVAEEFPWVEAYTPVNEPLTTARFSGLYGVWYPHRNDDASFCRALYNEIKGTVLAMREVRAANRSAQLIQTDDFGRTTSTPDLEYQAKFDNERRWLAFDLLFGLVDRDHYMYEFLTTRGGLDARDLDWLCENSCAPDIIGINHYPLSNRFLDHRLELYPKRYHGGNGRHAYADVGTVDTGQAETPLPYEILREVHERYHRPFAVTEAHVGGPRESQMRWFNEIWTAAQRLRREGADIRAVTAWSLVGSYDWLTLCTTCEGKGPYESGVFDLRSNEPRPTAMVELLKDLSTKGECDHPILSRGGYWRDRTHFLFAPSEQAVDRPLETRLKRRPILITGARGTLGRAFARLCETRGLDYRVVTREEMDIVERASVRKCLQEIDPWAIINTAGYVRVDDAEEERDRCFRENALGAKTLAEVASESGLPILTFSTDFVFDGSSERPYLESHRVAPVNIYGRSKAEAENAVLSANAKSLVVRTSSFFGPWDEHNFAHYVETTLRRREAVKAANDVIMSPTYVPHLASACLDLLIDGETGVLHLTNGEHLSWSDWAKRIAELFDLDRGLVTEVASHDLGLRAPRPKFSALESERMRVLPSFDEAMFSFKTDQANP